MGGHNKINLLGQTFNRLTVVEEIGRKQKSEVLWLCECECGEKAEATTNQLRAGKVQSCGCLRVDEGRKAGLKALRHGHGKDTGRSPTYNSWQSMKDRCLNQRRACSEYYRDVSVCDRWMAFENFLADMGERPEGKTLDRIDPFGNYEPENCRWATTSEQNKNTRTTVRVSVDGEEMTVSDLAEMSGLPYTTIHYRVHAGWSPDKILKGSVCR